METKTNSNTILKTNRLYMMVFIVVCSCIWCFQSKAEQIIQGIPCKGEVTYFKSNKLNSCFLSKDFTIDEYVLPAGTKLFLNENGKPSRCIISKETPFCGQSLPAQTNVFFGMWGEKVSFWLPQNTMIQGYLIGASDDGPGTPLYANGKLKEIWLVNDMLIDGVPCTSSANIFKYGWHVIHMGTERRVRFYDNGHLQRAMLSSDIIIQGHSYKKGELIYFDKEGKIDLRVKK